MFMLNIVAVTGIALVVMGFMRRDVTDAIWCNLMIIAGVILSFVGLAPYFM